MNNIKTSPQCVQTEAAKPTLSRSHNPISCAILKILEKRTYGRKITVSMYEFDSKLARDKTETEPKGTTNKNARYFMKLEKRRAQRAKAKSEEKISFCYHHRLPEKPSSNGLPQ
ncbi:hypothetical protein CICLE_v10023504mg [Citrus x clementina]|uniref:Uncharacterized protein n=1 Tax=Citrus clementina TaxID=85681 RepID=V4TNN2_CITCL|nr:hypothetical protein CICLE_v10023504mg [Citrus x clementina]